MPALVLRSSKQDGGEDGIRTHEALLRPTPLAGERLRPLGHLSGAPRWIKKTSGTINRNGERIATAATSGEKSRATPPIIAALFARRFRRGRPQIASRGTFPALRP